MLSDRQSKTLEAMSPEQRAAIEAIRARRDTPEGRAEIEQVRRDIRKEVPPAVPDEALSATLDALRAERARLGLSLADVSERTGMDRATISKLESGKVANPTYFTIRTYARALGKRVVWGIEDAEGTAISHTVEGLPKNSS